MQQEHEVGDGGRRRVCISLSLSHAHTRTRTHMVTDIRDHYDDDDVVARNELVVNGRMFGDKANLA